jgi:hypothetical protein
MDLLALAGLILVLEGVPYFVAPGLMKRAMSKIPELPEGTLRRWGIMAMAAGIVLVYLARH